MRRTLIGLIYDIHVAPPVPETPDELAERRAQIAQDEAECRDLAARLDEQDELCAAFDRSERLYAERLAAIVHAVPAVVHGVPKPVVPTPRSRERALGIIAGVLLAAAVGIVLAALQ